jgi:hypothetical protein
VPIFEKRKATKAQVERLAQKLNVEVDDETDDSNVCIFLYTPKGFNFVATDCHTAATSFSKFEGTKALGWGYCLTDLEYGIKECTNPNCGYCERGLQNE